MWVLDPEDQVHFAAVVSCAAAHWQDCRSMITVPCLRWAGGEKWWGMEKIGGTLVRPRETGELEISEVQCNHRECFLILDESVSAIIMKASQVLARPNVTSL